mgnify:CR=1 FL=1
MKQVAFVTNILIGFGTPGKTNIKLTQKLTGATTLVRSRKNYAQKAPHKAALVISYIILNVMML